MRLSSNMIGNSDDETNFLHKLLLTDKQVANHRKVFANNSSTEIIKSGLLLMKNVIKALAKSVILLRLTAAASAADAGIHKKILGSRTTTLKILYDEMEEIIKIVKSLEDSGLLLKGVKEAIQSEAKNKKEDFLVCS